MKSPDIDIRAQMTRMIERTLLANSEMAVPLPGVPAASVSPPLSNWEVQSVNADETLVTSPDQSAGIRTVVLTSVTYVNTDTGEIQTVPLVPGG